MYNKIKTFFVQCLVSFAALFVVAHTVAGVKIVNTQTTIVAALVLGLLNASLKPFIMMLTLPLNIFSLGTLTLFINGFVFYLAARFVKGFTVADFWSAFWAAAVFSVISFVLNVLIAPRVHFKVYGDRGDNAGQRAYKDVIDVEGESEDK